MKTPSEIFTDCLPDKYTPTPMRPSKLLAGDQAITSDEALVDPTQSTILFYPKDGARLGIPGGQLSLRLEDTGESIPLSTAESCEKGLYFHYHLRIGPRIA
jgi:hypothetical protein